ncbi:MAG: hypothetical protein FIB08_10990 [Candidatus Methanoperedens sp.]|nr:hypothetical protein [Candidatus Methanoperedens sp.]
MISLNYFGDSKYGAIGIDHFIRTYGIFSNDNNLFINIRCDRREFLNENLNFNININSSIENKNIKDIIYNSIYIFEQLKNLKTPSEFINTIPCISVDKNCITINIDIFYFIGEILTGSLESFWKSISISEKEKLGKVPFIDIYERMLFLILLYAFREQGQPFVNKSFWPGKSFAVCLTHDVDEVKKTYQWVTRPFMYLKKKQLIKGQLYSFWHKLHGREPYWTFDEIMKIEGKLNVRSSFYFLREKSKTKLFSPNTWKLLGRRYNFNNPKIRQIMKQLYEGGWEVGLHGSYESYHNPGMLEKEKIELQSALGHKISGIRQHHLNIDIPKTWEYQEKTGLKYDTTLGFKDGMGFRGGTSLPFHPYSAQKELNLLEIPLAIMDTPLFKCEKKQLSENFEEMVRTASILGGGLTLLWHHAVFNNHEFPGWSAAYEGIIEHSRKKDGWVTKASEISEWFRWREKAIIEWDYRGNCLRISPTPKESIHYLDIFLPDKISINKITNAEIVKKNKDSAIIRTNILENDDCVKIEFSELQNGT